MSSSPQVLQNRAYGEVMGAWQRGQTSSSLSPSLRQ